MYFLSLTCSPPQTYIVQQLPAGGVVSSLFLWKFRETHGSNNVLWFYLMPMSTGRLGGRGWGCSLRRALTAGPEVEGALQLDGPRLLFNDTHCLTILQLLPNVMWPHLHHRLPVEIPKDSMGKFGFKNKLQFLERFGPTPIHQTPTPSFNYLPINSLNV